MARVFLDSFSSPIAELPRGQRTIAHALRALDCNPRISTFDRGAPWLELLIHELKRDGLIVEDKAEPYPWHERRGGLACIEASRHGVWLRPLGDVVVIMPGSPARRNYAVQPTRIVLEDVVNGA
jgi:hypothetical protein